MRRRLVKFVIVVLMLFTVQVVIISAQSRGHAKTSAGSICIAAPDRPTTGDKSLANPAGGNPISSYAIQVDKMQRLVASNDKPVRTPPISLGRTHLIKIIGDGKVMHSFRFSFAKFTSNELCLWFNSLYETWSLWEAKEAGPKCSCK